MRKRMIYAICLLLMLPLSLYAQNIAPVVDNVTFSERTDGSCIVDIYYDVYDADGDLMTVFMQVSDDNGNTWNFSCNNITGDVGTDITNGSKIILWDFGTEHPETFGDQFRIKIIAYDVVTGTVTDIDGNVYQTIQIGDQEWIMENLKVTHYRNGDPITHLTSNSAWTLTSSGAYCVYGNNPSNAETYGNLYNWYAVGDSRGLAPEGWHVPTDDEWTTLANYLGGSSVAGGKLKETGYEHWNPPNTGATNESGFTALPGGYRIYFSGYYLDMGNGGYFWSSAEYGSYNAWYRLLYCNYSEIFRSSYGKKSGFSVRCIRD